LSDRSQGGPHTRRCAGFWGWAIVGGLAVFSLLSAASIGVLVAPAALIALAAMARSRPTWPEPLGVVAGAGFVTVAIGLLHLRAGGLDPVPWLIAGALLVAIACAAFARVTEAG
jgi:hypothetical protein